MIKIRNYERVEQRRDWQIVLLKKPHQDTDRKHRKHSAKEFKSEIVRQPCFYRDLLRGWHATMNKEVISVIYFSQFLNPLC